MMRLSTVQRMVLIAGLGLTAVAMHASHCRWRFGSMGSDVAIIGGPGPIVGGESIYDPAGLRAWQGGGGVFYAPTQAQYGLFSRYGIVSGLGIGVVTPIMLMTIATMLACSLRSIRRRERGLCQRCGYDVQYDSGRRCSECGWMSV